MIKHPDVRHLQRCAWLGLSLALLVWGCASAGTGRKKAGEGDQYLILAADLQATNQPTLYDAVRQIRPAWFTRRVPGRSGEEAIAVYVDNHLFGSPSSLRRLRVFGVDRVRYLGPTEAQIRFGQSNNGRAAIIVEMERSGN